MIIGIDIDDVLFDTTKKLIEYSNETEGTKIKYENIECYSLGNLLNKSEEEGLRFFENFSKTKNFIEMQPIFGAVEAINQLNKKHELVIITNRTLTVKKETHNSIKEHFGKNFNTIHILSNYLGKQTKTKQQTCQENNCTIMIEDAYHHAIECAKKGVKTLLYNRPWNEKEQSHQNIIRVNNWKEILEKINLQ